MKDSNKNSVTNAKATKATKAKAPKVDTDDNKTVKIASRKTAMDDLHCVSSANVVSGDTNLSIDGSSENYFIAIGGDITVKKFLDSYTTNVFKAISCVTSFKNLSKSNRLDFTVKIDGYLDLVTDVIDTIQVSKMSIANVTAIKTKIAKCKRVFAEYSYIVKVINCIKTGDDMPKIPKGFKLVDNITFIKEVKSKQESSLNVALDNYARILSKFNENDISIKSDLLSIGNEYKSDAENERAEIAAQFTDGKKM